MFRTLLPISSSMNELSKASQATGNFPLGVSVPIFILNFSSYTHARVHACTHTETQKHTLLFSGLPSPVSPFHYQSDLPHPTQCFPKHFITQTCPSTFLRPPVQCGHPMWEAPAAHGWQGTRSRCCQLGPASPAGPWAGHRG